MADEKPTYENNPLRRAYERASDQLASENDALRQEGEDVADMIGFGGGSGSGDDETVRVLREILEVQKQQRIEVNQRLEELRAAVETSSGGAGEWG